MDLRTTVDPEPNPDTTGPGATGNGPADLVFLSGPVHTVDPARTRASAVAVRGDRIIAVGHDAEVRDLIGPATEVVDLHGKLLIPGFQDAHVHPVGGGLELALCDLSAADTAEAYRELISAYAAAHPEAPWITGGGWSLEAFPGGMPTRGFLDALVPDRPVFLLNRDHHGGWANSRALERAGVTSRTPDPADGRIERDAEGHPTRHAPGGRHAAGGRSDPGSDTRRTDRRTAAGRSVSSTGTESPHGRTRCWAAVRAGPTSPPRTWPPGATASSPRG